MTGQEERQRRPRNRRQMIEQAAGEAFFRHGYHAVSMQQIADAVGITAPALYRHFPTKYDLLVRTIMNAADNWLAYLDNCPDICGQHSSPRDALALDAPGAPAHWPYSGATAESTLAVDECGEKPLDPEQARDTVACLVTCSINATIAQRSTAGVYRWDARYLTTDDHKALLSRAYIVVAHLMRRLAAMRPELTLEQAKILAIATLSLISSISAHRTVLAASAIRTLIFDAVWRVLTAPLPDAPSTPSRTRYEVEQPRRKDVVESAAALFARHGYSAVSVGDIAKEASLATSGIYRRFASKTDLLLSACERVSETLKTSEQRAQEQSTPMAAARTLNHGYIEQSITEWALTQTFIGEWSHLEPAQRRKLSALQREHLDAWKSTFAPLHPDLNSRELLFILIANSAMVSDLVVELYRQPDADTEALIRPISDAVLQIRPTDQKSNMI